MSDRDWLVPSIALTAISGLVAFCLIPDTSGILPAVALLPEWMIAAGIIGCIYGFCSMMFAGVKSPIECILEFVREPSGARLVVFGLLVAGLNMTTFMWTKPLLNYLIPFWTDPWLALIDNALFLGHDPWTLFAGLNTLPAAVFYHRGWFALLILALIIVLAAPASPKKSATLLTYFMLWSVVGPLIHTLLPAAGPIFYADLGYGDRFAGLHQVSETREVADYLWTVYAGAGFAPGAGISAMPSLHIATTTWILLAVHGFARRLFVPVAIAAAFIFVLSIALGWHYAADGIVGAVATLACYAGLRAVYGARIAQRGQLALA